MKALQELSDYINFTPADLELLRAAAPALDRHLPEMALAFYAAIERNPRAGAVLREGPKQVDQLKLSLERWARDLLVRPRDSQYAESRRRIGVKHADLGLDQRWVMAALGVVRGFLKGVLRTLIADAGRSAATLDALDRALDLDASLLSISYVDSANARRLAQRDDEDRATRKVQSLLLSGPGRLTSPDAIRQTLARLFPVEVLIIAVDRPAAGGVEIQGVDGTFPVAGIVPGAIVPYADCGLEQVIASGLTRAIALTADAAPAFHQALRHCGLVELTALPLWVDDRVIGALLLASRQAVPEAARRTDFLLGAADAVALAVARHQTALKLFDSEEQFRSLFDAVADGLFVVDREHRVRACNQVFLAMTHRSRDEVVGHTLQEFLPDEGGARLMARERDALSAGQSFGGEIALEIAGRRRWLAMSYAPIRSAAGEVVALTATARDTTTERERTAQQAHQHKMTSLGLLAAGIAHEVSNPLASIACIAQDLEETTADAESRDLLRRIVSSTQRASRSLQQVLKFVRPTGRDAAPVSVNETVTQTLDMASFDPRARGLSFETALAPELPPARASADDVSQVLLNILLNAMDAMAVKLGPPSGRPPAPRLANAQAGKIPDIVVHTRATQDSILIEVADRGPGIAPSQQQRIFEPFFTTKSVGRGTGLGLFVSAQIVQDLGGSITVSSVVGEGARFTIALPRVRV